MWIMIAGPYTSGTKTEQERIDNLAVMNNAALLVYEKGHVPIIGVNLALAVTELAEPERFDEIMMSISLAAAERCDACLRIGGASAGADQELAKFRAKGLPVFTDVDEISSIN